MSDYVRPEPPVHWVADGMPRVELANQFLAQLDHAGGTPDLVVLTVGQTVDAGTPPTVLSAHPVGRYALTPARLDELIMVLLNARQELLDQAETAEPGSGAAGAGEAAGGAPPVGPRTETTAVGSTVLAQPLPRVAKLHEPG